MRSIRAHYSVSASSQPVKGVFREEDITHEFANLGTPNSHNELRLELKRFQV